MTYKYSKGKVFKGDIYNEDDTQRNTYLDWSEDAVGFVAGGELCLVVSGSGAVSSSLNLSASAFYGDGSGLSNVSATASPAGSDGQIQYNNGGSTGGGAEFYWDDSNNRVGIGTDAPDYTLDVAGNIGVDQYIYHNGDGNTLINFADDKIILKAGGKAMITMEEKGTAPHEITLNDGGNNIDFVVKGNGSNGGNPGMKFDASNNRLGINGVGTPSWELDVAGDIGLAEYIYHKGDTDTYIQFSDDEIVLYAGGRGFLKCQESGSSDKLMVNYGGLDVELQVKGENENNLIRTNAEFDKVGICYAPTAQEDHELTVVGNVSASVNVSASAFYGDGSNLENVSVTVAAAGSTTEIQYNNNGSRAGADTFFYDADNKRVGIGESSPDYTLHVAGDIGADQYIYHNGDSNTYLQFTTDIIELVAGGESMIKMNEGGNLVTVNNGSNDLEFRVLDNAGETIFTAHGTKSTVGIHNDTPDAAYDLVVGDDVLIVSGSSVGIGSAWSGKELHVTDGNSNTPSAPADSQVVVESGGNAGISLLSAGSRARIYFGDDSDIDEGIIEYKFTNSERFNITVNANEVMRIYESGASNTITTLNGVKTTAGLFTEGHPYYSNDANISVGDCCVLDNGQIVRSSSPMQKNVGGIAWYSVLDDLQNPGPSGDNAWPLTLDDNTVSRIAEDALGVQCDMAEESGGEWVPTPKFQTLWKLAAVGDSRQSNYGTTALTGFKVCNEGGEISAGDLLCTSTTPGYLMKQPDDIMRSYTVGKAMEAVTFNSNGQATGIYGYLYCG